MTNFYVLRILFSLALFCNFDCLGLFLNSLAIFHFLILIEQVDGCLWGDLKDLLVFVGVLLKDLGVLLKDLCVLLEDLRVFVAFLLKFLFSCFWIRFFWIFFCCFCFLFNLLFGMNWKIFLFLLRFFWNFFFMFCFSILLFICNFFPSLFQEKVFH